MDNKTKAKVAILEHVAAALDFQNNDIDISAAAEAIKISLMTGGIVFTCGNGGSAADALHFTAELLGKFQRQREALPSVCLNADVATMTAIANDYGYAEVFSRQINALGNNRSVLVAITTSGMSPNILDAIGVAQSLGMKVVALTGKGGGAVAENLLKSDIEIRVPSNSTPRIQELHTLSLHIICQLIDDSYESGKN